MTGIYSDENGYFLNLTLESDTIIISCIGYEDKIISSGSVKDTILLHPNVVKLNEVLIVSHTKSTNETLGYLKKRSNYYIGLPPQTEIATLINYPDDRSSTIMINRVIIDIKIRDTLKCFFRFHLYEFDPITTLPGKELLNNNRVFNTADVKSRFIAEMHNEWITFPKNGLFVSIELMGPIHDLIGPHDVAKSTDPMIRLTNKYKNNYTFIRGVFANNNWTVLDREHPFANSENYLNMSVAVSVDITY